MPTGQVHCIRQLAAAPDDVWAVLGTFDLTWHPFVASCKLLRDEGGALLRDFETVDGGRLVEQRSYVSDVDRVLCYMARSGIAGADAYHARVEVTEAEEGCLVTWHADIRAGTDRVDAIVAGTEAVFEAGLDRLETELPTRPSAKPVSSARASVRQGQIDGTPRLGYLTAGECDGTLVLFLHGIGGQASNWGDQLLALGGDFAVAAMNLRGYGDSTLGFEQTQIDGYCEDIRAMAAQFGAERLVLVGLSMGSWIATSFALRHPDLLAGLVLAGGCTGMSEADPRERETFRVSREVPLSQGQTPADFAPTVVETISGPNASVEARRALQASMAAIPSSTYRDALNCFTNPIETFDFSRIACPVLMITGEHDKLAPPREIRRVSERIFDAGIAARGASDVRFEVLEDAGHVCNLEQPDAFNRLLDRFLRRLPGVANGDRLSRTEKQLEKRNRILKAAHDEFCAVGFDGASMDRLARAADVSKPTLYQYFGDKEGLLSAVLDRGRSHIVAPLHNADGSLVERLWRFSWTYADFVLRPDMLSLARLILGEAARRPETAAAYHRNGPGRAFEGLVEFVEDAAKSGELVVDAPDLAAQNLWSLILSGPRDYYLHHVDDRPSEEDVLRSIGHGLTVFLKAYGTSSETQIAELEAFIATKNDQLRAQSRRDREFD